MSKRTLAGIAAAALLFATSCQRASDTYTLAPITTESASADTTNDPVCADPSAIPLPQPTTPGTQRVTVIGDSYLTTPPVYFPDLIWQQLNAQGPKVTPTVGAEGGTGYTNCGAAEKTIYIQRVDRLVSNDDSLVVFIGGRNDRYTSPPVLELIAHQTFVRAMELAPKARLLVIGPIFPGEPPAAMRRVSETLKKQTELAGGTYIDPITLRWMSEPGLTKDDGVHPNAAGNQYLADKIGPLIAAHLEPHP